jgi:serine/threonine protein kinase
VSNDSCVNSPEELRRLEAQLVGKPFADRYEILSLIGEGGAGLVFKARHVHMNRFVAIKIIRPELVSNQTALQRFKQEAKAISAISHQNIVAVHDFGITSDEMPYLVMDLIEGISLADLIRAEGRMPYQRAVPLFRQACVALDHAHHSGIVHRDLKANNIMVVGEPDRSEEVKLVDFGMAKLVRPELHGENVQELTQHGDVFGSPLYMSPEQCKGQTLDGRSDIYSLGCVMYYVLTGDPPFVGQNMLETLQKHINDEPTPPEYYLTEEELPRQLRNIVLKSLSKNPEDRYQSMAEMIADIDALNAGRRTVHATTHSLKKVQKASAIKVNFGISAIVMIACVGMAAFVTGRLFDDFSETQDANMWVDYTQEGTKALRARDYSLAEKKYLEAITEARKFGHNDPRLANSMISLGATYVEDKQFIKGENWIKRGIEMFEKCYGQNCVELYPALVTLAKAYEAEGKTAEAEKIQEKALIVLEPHEDNRAKMVNFLNQAAKIKRREGDTASAEHLEQKAHSIQSGEKDPKP